MFVCEINVEFTVDHLSMGQRLHKRILDVLKDYEYFFDEMPTMEVFEDTPEEHDDDDDEEDWNEYDRDEWEDEA